jgi:hypothetical protein
MSKSPAECPLNSQYFGIVSETDHRNGLCLCPLCTCKQHVCPSALSKEPYPKSMYGSQYSDNFQNQKYSKPLVCLPPNKPKSSQPVNFTTTSEEYYRPVHSPVALVIPGYIPSPLPETKFLGKSSYNSTFANWGNGGVYYVTQQHLKHTSHELQLNTKTNYKDNFVEIEKEELIKPRKLGIEVATVQKGMGLKVNNAPSLKESMSHRDFPDYSKKSLTSREKKEYERIPNLKYITSHYMTMNQADYVSHPIQVDHRNVRKQYERKLKLV